MKSLESTSYLTIEVLSDEVHGDERVIHIRKICTGNPVEQFITDSVIRVPVVKEVEEVKVTTKTKEPVRARIREVIMSKMIPPLQRMKHGQVVLLPKERHVKHALVKLRR